MFKSFISILAGIIFLIPNAAWAGTVGFVPSTGIWFSRTEFLPKETVRIYTAVVNNDYATLTGLVGFYDNNKLIDTAVITALNKEQALQLRVFWQPDVGSHSVSARFIKAEAIDEKGVRKILELKLINNSTGVPLFIDEKQIVPAVVAPGTLADDGVTLGSAQVVVAKEGDHLQMTAPEATAGQKISAPSSVPVQIAGTIKEAENAFAKNREALNKVEQTFNAITSTVNKVQGVYTEAKSVVEKGKEYYAQGEAWWKKIEPYALVVWGYWLVISDNNNPKRIAIMALILVVIWYLYKRSRRRRFYDDYYSR